MAVGILRPRPLESALFGRSICSGTVTSEPEMVVALAEAAGLGRALIVLRAPAGNMRVVQQIESAGGRLCDVLLTFKHTPREMLAKATGVAGTAVIRAARADDESRIAGLASRAFKEFRGHWHLDQRLSPERSTELYARWAADLTRASGPRQLMFVAEDGAGDLSGFLALATDDGVTWHVPLTAVDPEHRGRGTLAQLLLSASRHLSATPGAVLHYETQIDNHAALRVLARFGFALEESRFTFHLWSGDSDPVQ